jgi:hypothetical protein
MQNGWKCFLEIKIVISTLIFMHIVGPLCYKSTLFPWKSVHCYLSFKPQGKNKHFTCRYETYEASVVCQYAYLLKKSNSSAQEILVTCYRLWWTNCISLTHISCCCLQKIASHFYEIKHAILTLFLWCCLLNAMWKKRVQHQHLFFCIPWASSYFS